MQKKDKKDKFMRMCFALVTVLMLILCGSLTVQSNEPLWTEEERAVKSDAVFIGVVQSVRQIRELNEYESLFSATVQLKAVEKNHDSLAKGEVTLYFERPKDGRTGKRCPTYVELAEKQQAKFYVRIREINKEKLPSWKWVPMFTQRIDLPRQRR